MKIIFLFSLVLTLALLADAPLKSATFPFKLRGYFYAYSEKVTGLGGHGKSGNMPKEVPVSLKLPPGLHLVFDLSKPVSFANGYEGLMVRLVNTSGREVVLQACDSRIDIVTQAKDENGEWKDIEYLPSSWCGNSYHTLSLPDQRCWEFVAPRYSGPFKTELRHKLTRRDAEPVYSEAYQGSVDPRQFTLEQGYAPQNVMDPYNN